MGRYSAAGNAMESQDFFRSRWERSDFGAAAIQENLEFVRDKKWVINECLRRVCSTAEATSALLSYGLAQTDGFRNREIGDDEARFYFLRRLRLLQFKDRLDTFLGIHMGRFSSKKFAIFRSSSLHRVATTFAEHGKTGALELLIKRHGYTLAPHILTILDEIPETLSPHTYVQLLPKLSPPQVLLPRRGQDWVENDAVLSLAEAGVPSNVSFQECTEYMVNLSRGLRWPDGTEITAWYLQRARRIDQVSGQLENSLFLLDAGIQNKVSGLNELWKDIADLCRVSFSNAECQEVEADLTLAKWENLDPFDKFKMMLRDVNEENVVDRLVEVAVPFAETLTAPEDRSQRFLVRYLKEVATTNLQLCAVIFEDAERPPYKGVLFKDEADAIATALDCIYSCSETDQWTLMASILSKLSWEDEKQKTTDSINERGIRRGFVKALRYPNRVSEAPLSTEASVNVNVKKRNPAISDELERRLRQAEGRIQAGKILFQYQTPTTIGFLASSSEDVKGTKQIIRILLSKFLRKQPSRPDGEWDALWRDLQVLQEKVFTFLEKDYLLSEFCRGLLKSEKFELAKSYFAMDLLSAEKIESLVLQTSREYFYSASNLESYDIDKAKECLSLIPDSETATAEHDLIVAVTEKLPYLGVTLLPAQFRQIKDPMDVLKMAIESPKGLHIPLGEVFEVAKLLGFKDASKMAVVEEALAREAAAHGDVALAQELCLGLTMKDHGNVWDLCVAIGRGPEVETLDLKSRKALISFALRHCDEESIGELLDAWKEFDLVDDYLPVTLIEESDSVSTERSEEEEEVDMQASEEPVIFQKDLDGDVPGAKDDALATELETVSPQSLHEATESTLSRVARISNDIVGKEFADAEISEADLTSIDAAISCFSRLAERTSSKKQALALKVLLDEWDGVFDVVKERNEESLEEDGDKDGEDGWGDGWQDFEVAETVVSKLHPLWMDVYLKLVQFEGLEEALAVLDKWSRSSRVPLTEEEAQELANFTAKENLLSAVKLALLMPYESLRSTYGNRLGDCSQAVDKATMTLLLSGGLLPSIASSSDSSGLFSALLKIFSELVHRSQAGLLLPEDSLGAPSLGVIVPYFISELTRGRHYRAAASLVLQLMRVPRSLATWNVSHYALRHYLQAQQQQMRQKKEGFDSQRLRESSISYLCETISRMVDSFDAVVGDALSTLAKDMK